MIEGNAKTLAGLLPKTLNRFDHIIESEIAKDAKASFPGFAWKMIGTEADDAVRRKLDDTDVFEILTKAWCSARELHKYADRTKHPPREKSVVFLGEHSLTVNIHPDIVIKVGPTQFPPLHFTLELKANVRSAALTIQDGHIKSLGAGDCFATAQLKYGDVNLHDELESKHLFLPGKLEFRKPGLSIL